MKSRGNERLSLVLNHFKQVDPKIYAYMTGVNFGEWFIPAGHSPRRTHIDYFAALCREIVGQQLSGKAARSIFAKFVTLFEDSVPTPPAILALKDEHVREKGLSWAKIKYIKDLAARVEGGELRLDRLDKLGDEEIVMQLTAVKGIGPWTAEMFLMFTLGREDVFSFGDLGLKKGFEKVYGVVDPSRAQIEKTIKPWVPYRSYGAITLWHSLEV